ncbi:MAG: nucleotidyltransferase domain-containing protein [bacterium]
MKQREGLIQKFAHYFEDNAENLHVELAFLYGSWAAGRQHENSDIDLAVLFAADAGSDDDKYRAISEISEDLGADLHKEVNVVELRWEFDKPMLYYNAAIHGVVLYMKDRRLLDFFLKEAVFQMEDFCIFGIHWQLFAARRNLKGVTHA